MSVLVTGGAGFIGSNFVLDWLAQCDEPVINLDALTYAGNLENLASLHGDGRHVFVKGDIGDAALVSSLLAEHQPRAVVNFAAESHVDRSIHGPAEFIQTNIVGTFNLLESVRAYWSGLEGAAEFLYKTTGYYAPEHERCIVWNDPDLAIAWPIEGEPVLSAKYARGAALASAEVFA